MSCDLIKLRTTIFNGLLSLLLATLTFCPISVYAGTAALAGVSIGAITDLKKTVGKMAKVRKVFEPNLENKEIYAALYKKYANLYKAVKGL